jgi:hypothetical protein
MSYSPEPASSRIPLNRNAETGSVSGGAAAGLSAPVNPVVSSAP